MSAKDERSYVWHTVILSLRNDGATVEELANRSGTTIHTMRRVLREMDDLGWVIWPSEDGTVAPGDAASACLRMASDRDECVESSPTVLDLFCGAGGFSLGFEAAGFDVIAGIDENNNALATYYCNNDSSAHNIDLRAATPEEVLAEVGVAPDDVDVIVGGPPCQGHSVQGKQDPDDPRNKLMDDYLDIIDYVNPRAFAMENVPGLLTTDDGAFLAGVLDRVEEMGYTVDSGVLDADQYGVPQTRSRFFLVGIRGGDPFLPAPTAADPTPVYEVLNRVQLRDDLPNNDWRSQKASHGKSTVDDYYTTPLGVDPYENSDQQVRLALDRPGRTIVADNFHFHPHQPRYLTVREAAALQTFPDDYHFFGGVGSQRKQVGNAVPPMMAEHIARTVRESLEQTDLQGQAMPTDHKRVPADD